MRFVTFINELSLPELKAIAAGTMQNTVTDVDFLETLAAHKCIIVPPWIMRAAPSGGLCRVAEMIYDGVGNMDKAAVLVAMAREFKRAKKSGVDFGPRFSS